MMRIPKFLSGLQGVAFTATSAVKIALMTITPMSFDLAFLVDEITAPSKWANAPYGIFMQLIFRGWQLLPVDHPQLVTSWTPDYFNGSPGLYILVFLLKFPLLLLDILTGYVLFTIVRSEGLGDKKASMAFWLWFLNPYVFLVNEMWAAVDLLPSLLLLVALAALQRKKIVGGAFAFAAATAFKLFPILLLPVFPALGKRSRTTALFVTMGLVGIGVYFWWTLAAGFDPWLALKQYDPFTQYFDEYVIATLAGETVGLATVGLIVSYAIIGEKWVHDRTEWLDAALLVFLVFFAFGNWFPQYFIWAIPLVTFDVAIGRRRRVYLLSLIASALFMGIAAFYFYFTSVGHAFFFMPLYNQSITSALGSYTSFVRDNLVVLLLGPLARTIFITTCMLYILKLVQSRTSIVSHFFDIIRKRE